MKRKNRTEDRRQKKTEKKARRGGIKEDEMR
jgi:hypothetical protein